MSIARAWRLPKLTGTGEGSPPHVHGEERRARDEDVEIAKSIIHQLRVREDSLREYRERLENKIKEYHTSTQ